MLRLMQLRLAVGLLTAGILAVTAASAWAFSQQNAWPGGSGASMPTDSDNQFTDPDNENSGKGIRPFGSNGPVVQFGVQQNTFTPFGLSKGDNTSTPDPYYQPLLHGN